MSGNNKILSLLGLALRGGRLAVGEEPAALAAKAGQARLLLAASDAAGNTLRRAEHLAEESHCLRLVLPFSKAELGEALGRDSAAIAALTDLGLADAVAERLAQLDPARYGETAARMDLKRRRAAERKAAPRRSPPPKGRDTRSPKPRREGDRFHSPQEGRKPGEQRAGKPRNPTQNGKRKAAGAGRPYSEKPGKAHSRSGRPDCPGERGPAGKHPRSGKPGRPPQRGGTPRPKPPFGRDKGGGR